MTDTNPTPETNVVALVGSHTPWPQSAGESLMRNPSSSREARRYSEGAAHADSASPGDLGAEEGGGTPALRRAARALLRVWEERCESCQSSAALEPAIFQSRCWGL